jgi:hypothetical protein
MVINIQIGDGAAHQQRFRRKAGKFILRRLTRHGNGAFGQGVHRLRQRYRDLVRAEIAQTVSSPEAMEEELGHLFGR